MSKYKPNAGGLRISPRASCTVCSFSVEKSRADVVAGTEDDPNPLWQHRDRDICVQRLESLALSDELLGGKREN